MQLSARPAIGGFPRVVLAFTGILVLLGFAIAIAFDRVALGLEIVAIIAMPALLYVAYRSPIVFPLGLYIVSVPLDPLLKAGGGTASSLSRFIGIATIAALLLHAYRMRRLFAPPRAWYAWAAYVFLCFLSLAWSIDPNQTGDTLSIMASQFALYTATTVYPITSTTYRTVRRTIVVAGTLTALYGIYAYLTGQRLNGNRLSLSVGTMHYDSNHYAAFFMIPIGILAARLFFTQNWRDRMLCSALLLLMFGNVLLTGSRGGLIAATLLTVYVGFRARRYLMLGATALAGLAMSFALPNVWARILDPSQGDASGRGEIWSVGFSIIREYGLIGCGFAAFPMAYDENLNHAVQRLFAGYGRPAHNVLIQTTAELGIAGIAILLLAWWTSLRENAFISRTSAYFMDRCAYEGATIGIFVCALTIDLLWFKYFWLCLTMVALLTNVARPTLLFGRRRVAQRPYMARPVEAVREPVSL